MDEGIAEAITVVSSYIVLCIVMSPTEVEYERRLSEMSGRYHNYKS